MGYFWSVVFLKDSTTSTTTGYTSKRAHLWPHPTVMLAEVRGEPHMEHSSRADREPTKSLHLRAFMPRLVNIWVPTCVHKTPVNKSRRTCKLLVMTWWEVRPMIDEYAKMVMKILGLNGWSVPGTLNGWARPARHLDRAWNTSSKIISPVLSSCRKQNKTHLK